MIGFLGIFILYIYVNISIYLYGSVLGGAPPPTYGTPCGVGGGGGAGGGRISS